MGDALELAKKRLGLDHKPGESNPKEKVNEDLSLEEAISKIDSLSAREAVRASVREITASANVRAQEAEARLRGGDHVEDKDGEKKRQEEEAAAKKQLCDSAISLINSGMDPRQVGQFLLGLPSVGGSATPIVSQGMGLEDILKIINLVTEKKESSELRTLIASLDKKIEDLSKNPPNRVEPTDPVAAAEHQVATLVQLGEALDKLKPLPATVATAGEPIDVVKERNRHEETMEGIRGDARYKDRLSDIAGDTFERIGAGLGRQIVEGETEQGGDGKTLEFIMCTGEGCGKKIRITPDTGDMVTCGNCGAIYNRKEMAKS